MVFNRKAVAQYSLRLPLRLPQEIVSGEIQP